MISWLFPSIEPLQNKNTGNNSQAQAKEVSAITELLYEKSKATLNDDTY